jgi:hypothetical protein
VRESGHGRVALVRELFGIVEDAPQEDVEPVRDNVRRLRGA